MVEDSNVEKMEVVHMENVAAGTTAEEQTEKIVELDEEQTVEMDEEKSEVAVEEMSAAVDLSHGSYGDIDSYYETSHNQSKSRLMEYMEEHNLKSDEKLKEHLLYSPRVRK